jgi:pimeloyl-ACP methyl ester carboxylesterase
MTLQPGPPLEKAPPNRLNSSSWNVRFNRRFRQMAFRSRRQLTVAVPNLFPTRARIEAGTGLIMGDGLMGSGRCRITPVSPVPSDRWAGRKVECPILALWGVKGALGQLWDVLDVWREHASGTVDGRALNSGHYLAEEQPEEVLDELLRFFAV